MPRGLIRAVGAFAAASSLASALLSGNILEDAQKVVDLGVEKDGKAMMYADGEIMAVDPEDARCADMANCQGLAQFAGEVQQAAEWTTPEVLQNVMGTYLAERQALNHSLGQDIPNALEHVNIAHPSRDDVVFVRQGFTDILNMYGTAIYEDADMADQVDLKGLTRTHNILYGAEQALQAYKDFEKTIDESSLLSEDMKSQVKYDLKVMDRVSSLEVKSQPKPIM